MPLNSVSISELLSLKMSTSFIIVYYLYDGSTRGFCQLVAVLSG